MPMSGDGPTRSSGDVRSRAPIGGKADVRNVAPAKLMRRERWPTCRARRRSTRMTRSLLYHFAADLATDTRAGQGGGGAGIGRSCRAELKLQWSTPTYWY